MQPQYPWLRVIHGGACDVRRLQEIVVFELERASVVRIIGGAPRGDVLAHWTGVGEALGGQVDLAAYGATGAWMDLGFEPNGRACARPGEIAQPLHNDQASVEALAGTVGLFHCGWRAPGGGRTLFVDAGVLADVSRRRAPDLHDLLFSTPILFGGAGRGERAGPVLRRQGNRLTVAWNDFRVSPGQGEAVERLRHRLRLLLQDMVLTGEAAALPLEAGDVVFFRADEVLHGREAPSRGVVAPLVSKCYFRPGPEEVRNAA